MAAMVSASRAFMEDELENGPLGRQVFEAFTLRELSCRAIAQWAGGQLRPPSRTKPREILQLSRAGVGALLVNLILL